MKAKPNGKGGDIKVIATTKDRTDLSAECTVTVEMFSKIKEEKTEYKDKDKNIVVVPQGFAIGTSDNVNRVTKGVVIQDNEGNQFVWIPVGNVKDENGNSTPITLARYSFDSEGNEKIEQDSINYEKVVTLNGYDGNLYQELTYNSDNTSAKNLKDFIDKTKAAGGYYFARYESSQGENNKPLSQGNKVPWLNVTQQNAATYARAYSNDYVESDLINSYSWDTAIVFIQKYSGNSNYANATSKNKGSSVNTGLSGDKVCNVNDMASNFGEWTTVHSMQSPHPLVAIGGMYNADNFTTRIYARGTNASAPATASRVIIYVK